MGKPKYIETPELMWQYFLQYKEEVKSNPILVHDFVGKDGDEAHRKKERPLTMEGFENWLFRQDIIAEISDYLEDKQGRYTDYAPICRAIRREIRQDQIDGGMAGIYNPSITQRLQGLVEKSQADDKKEITINVKRGDRHNTQQPASGADTDQD